MSAAAADLSVRDEPRRFDRDQGGECGDEAQMRRRTGQPAIINIAAGVATIAITAVATRPAIAQVMTSGKSVDCVDWDWDWRAIFATYAMMISPRL
jgi:hypothetical protein